MGMLSFRMSTLPVVLRLTTASLSAEGGTRKIAGADVEWGTVGVGTKAFMGSEIEQGDNALIFEPQNNMVYIKLKI
jgi:hypothetical protein